MWAKDNAVMKSVEEHEAKPLRLKPSWIGEKKIMSNSFLKQIGIKRIPMKKTASEKPPNQDLVILTTNQVDEIEEAKKHNRR